MRTYSFLLVAMLANHEPEIEKDSSTDQMLIMENPEDALDGKGENKYRGDLRDEVIQKQEAPPLESPPDMSKKRARHH